MTRTQREIDDTGWMLLSSGKAFTLADTVFDVSDIAWSLAKQCRYGGHVRRSQYYSVARHCVLVADWLYQAAVTAGKTQSAARYVAWCGLMHDAAEHILCDVVRPMKVNMPDYYELEAVIEKKLFKHLDVAYPMLVEVKEADNRILLDEKEQIMPDSPRPWGIEDEFEPLGVVIPEWESFRKDAEDFLKAARKYSHVPLN